MLIMDIFTWEPARAEEVIKHRVEEKIPEGVKIVGEWVDIGGGRTYRLVEFADPNLLAAMSFFWTGFCKRELVPVLGAEDMMKLLAGG